jgi:hypothetical protein
VICGEKSKYLKNVQNAERILIAKLALPDYSRPNPLSLNNLKLRIITLLRGSQIAV